MLPSDLKSFVADDDADLNAAIIGGFAVIGAVVCVLLLGFAVALVLMSLGVA